MDRMGAGMVATPIRSGPLRLLEVGGGDGLKGVDAAREVFDAAREVCNALRVREDVMAVRAPEMAPTRAARALMALTTSNAVSMCRA